MLELTSEEQHWYFHWIHERERCRLGYEGKLPKPWSADPILQNYRFCNVRREDDKVTKWIRDSWRDPYDGDPNMVLAMVVARTVNWPDTLEEIGFPNFVPREYHKWFTKARTAMKARRAAGEKVWTGAYLVSTNGHKMDKIDYIIDKVWGPIWEKCPVLGLTRNLAHAHKVLTQFDGMGSFMAGQVICDLKYTSVLAEAEDWNTWSAIGPGSKRGMNRFFGVANIEAAISPTVYHKNIATLQCLVAKYCNLALHAQDIQNTLCEFDKYCRVRKLEGRPRSGYNGAR